jgi:hypothetical protein
MCQEYSLRYHREHKAENIIYSALAKSYLIPEKGLLVPPKAMPEEVKIGQNSWEDVIASYRNFYHIHKIRFAKWNYSEKPQWWLY